MVLAGWSQTDKTAFAKWYSGVSDADRSKAIAAQMAKDPMPMQQYIDALKAVDFSSSNTIDKFTETTQIRDHDPAPRPILLGSDAGSNVVYQLHSKLVDDLIPSKADTPKNVKLSDYVMEIKATAANTQSPVQYIFMLGDLRAAPSASPTTPGEETPYRVCINPVDRSIWLLMLGFTLDSNGGPVPIPTDADTWTFLNAKANGRASFDVMRIATWSEFIALTQSSAVNRPIFGTQAIGTSKRIFPKAVWPTAEAVEKALKP